MSTTHTLFYMSTTHVKQSMSGAHKLIAVLNVVTIMLNITIVYLNNPSETFKVSNSATLRIDRSNTVIGIGAFAL